MPATHDHEHVDPHSGHVSGHADDDPSPNGPTDTNAIGLTETAMATVATVGVVGVAAVVFEAALIPGMVLGVAAALAPSYVPRLGAAINPILRSSLRGAYKLGHKTREMMSEAREHLHDIAAEVEAEKDSAVSAPGSGVKGNGTAHA